MCFWVCFFMGQSIVDSSLFKFLMWQMNILINQNHVYTGLNNKHDVPYFKELTEVAAVLVQCLLTDFVWRWNSSF